MKEDIFNAFMLALIFFFLVILALRGEEMRVLMVNEDGKVNIPETLATTAQLATNETAIIIAEAKAEGAKEAARQGTNLVANVVSQIMANELVVYRKGFTDSFASAILISEDDKFIITKLEPFVATDGNLIANEITYAITANIGAVKPLIKTHSSLGSGDFIALQDSRIGEAQAVEGTYTDEDGTEYSNLYKVRFWVEAGAEREFFTVYLNGGTPEGDGSVLTIRNGIQGGASAVVEWGGNKLTFKGGLLVSVEEVTE